MKKVKLQPYLESLAQLRHSLTQGEDATASPYYEKVRDSDFYSGIFTHGPFRQSDEPRIIAADYVLCAALCWPACNFQALRDFSTISLVFVERDDVIDADDGRDVRRMLESCVADADQDFTTTYEDQFGPLMKIVWDSLRTYVPPGQLDRLTKMTRDYFHGCLETAERHAVTETYADLEEYLRARRRTIGQAIDQILIEISLGIDLSAECENPLLWSLNSCDIERVILLQDLQSFYKEILAGESEENAVSVIARSKDINVLQAAQLTLERFHDTMDRYDELSALLIAETGSSRISHYVNGMSKFVTGLISWNSRSPRYGGSNT